MATRASVFLSTWRDQGVILYEVNPRYHTREAGIILGYCHGVSRYYHLPVHREELVHDTRLLEAVGLESWLDGLTAVDRSPRPGPARASLPSPPQADSWDPTMHPPIL